MTNERVADIAQVTFIGAGTMGCANALAAGLAGYRAVLYDVSVNTLERVPETLQGMVSYLLAMQLHSVSETDAALALISTQAHLALAVEDADLVSESVPESRAIKRQVFREIEALVSDHCLLTTNTSGLLVSDMEDVLKNGKRFAALHSHLGAPLYDIVPGLRTSAETLDGLRRYVLSLGGTPLVLKKENTGYVLNAMLGSLLSTAQRLVISGRAGVEQIDAAWMHHRAAPMGPFGMMDLFGLDVVLGSWGKPQAEDVECYREAITPWLQHRVDDGLLGMKSGSGFYRYPDPAYQHPSFLAVESVSDDCHALLMASVVQKAMSIVDKGVAEPESIDLAWCVGTHAESGPYQWLQQASAASLLAVVDASAFADLLYPPGRQRLQGFTA